MTKTVRVLVAFALMLVAGCGSIRPIPDQTIPHRVSQTLQVPLWVKTPSGEFIEGWYTIHEGWWVASPAIIEGDDE
jgi:hypothetical protein